MNKISKVLAGIGMTFAMVFGLAALAPANVSAVVDSDGSDLGSGTGSGAEVIGDNENMAAQLFGDDGVVTRIISVVIFIVGGLCVIMLVWGGVQYILSAGDTAKVTSAKNTILYAVIGLIVTIIAYAVVQFVLKNLQG